MIRALITEDEIHCQQLIIRKIQKHFPEIHIVDCVSSLKEASTILAGNEIDLLFLDNCLKDGKGLDLLREFPVRKFEVIITTAYPEYAIDALNANSCYYLLKPFSEEELCLAVDKAMQRLFTRTESILIGKIQFKQVRYDQIAYLRSNGAYTGFILTDDSEVIASRNLGYYEKRLPVSRFYRIHHSYLVNLGSIETIKKENGLHLKLKGIKGYLTVSERKATAFLKFMRQL